MIVSSLSGGFDGLFGEEGSDSPNSKDGTEGNDKLDGGTGLTLAA
jgi:hypothetical protein